MPMTQRRLDRHKMRAINVSTTPLSVTRPILLALSAVSAHSIALALDSSNIGRVCRFKALN
jgi:hypothetical protein